jgi:hypothetical protein
MSKIVLMCLLAVVSNSAFADWIYVDSTDNFDSYANQDTIRKNGSIVKMWQLDNYNVTQKDVDQANGKEFFSVIAQQEHDCKEERTRPLALTYYAKNMGAGDVIYNQTFTGYWQPVLPGSMAESMWKVACGVK